jgi:hypothetical protein
MLMITSVLMAALLATPATFAGVYAHALPGDTISLAPGAYGDLVMKRPASISGPPDAVFSSVSVTPGASGLSASAPTRLDDFSCAEKVTPTTTSASACLKIQGVKAKDGTITPVAHVVASGLRIVCGNAVSGVAPDSDPTLPRPGEQVLGWPIGIGVGINYASDVTLQGSDISQCMKGVGIGGDGLKILANNIHDVRTSPIVGASVTNSRIEANWLHDSRPWRWGWAGGAGDHGDWVHIWTVAGVGPVHDLTIRGNLIEQGDGGNLLGVYLDDGAAGGGFYNIRVERNVFLMGNNQGIRFENVKGTVLDNVFLQSAGGQKDGPSIILAMGSVATLTGNKATDSGKAFVTHPGNTAMPGGIVQPQSVLDFARTLVLTGPGALQFIEP